MIRPPFLDPKPYKLPKGFFHICAASFVFGGAMGAWVHLRGQRWLARP